MQRFAYPITLAVDEVDGGFVVNCRDLPVAITQGDTLEDAIEATTKWGMYLTGLVTNNVLLGNFSE